MLTNESHDQRFLGLGRQVFAFERLEHLLRQTYFYRVRHAFPFWVRRERQTHRPGLVPLLSIISRSRMVLRLQGDPPPHASLHVDHLVAGNGSSGRARFRKFW